MNKTFVTVDENRCGSLISVGENVQDNGKLPYNGHVDYNPHLLLAQNYFY